MNRNNVTELKKPETFVDDPLTEILRSGARKLLAEALEAEIESFLAMYTDLYVEASDGERDAGSLVTPQERAKS